MTLLRRRCLYTMLSLGALIGLAESSSHGAHLPGSAERKLSTCELSKCFQSVGDLLSGAEQCDQGDNKACIALDCKSKNLQFTEGNGWKHCAGSWWGSQHEATQGHCCPAVPTRPTQSVATRIPVPLQSIANCASVKDGDMAPHILMFPPGSVRNISPDVKGNWKINCFDTHPQYVNLSVTFYSDNFYGARAKDWCNQKGEASFNIVSKGACYLTSDTEYDYFKIIFDSQYSRDCLRTDPGDCRIFKIGRYGTPAYGHYAESVSGYGALEYQTEGHPPLLKWSVCPDDISKIGWPGTITNQVQGTYMKEQCFSE